MASDNRQEAQQVRTAASMAKGEQGGQLVLVTGGTGFIAQHCILALLSHGYRVRTTVRTLARETEVRRQLATGGIDAGERLSFVVADLMDDAGWAQAAAGCAYVIHGASPTPAGEHADEDAWIKPAVEGNLRVLRAARDSGVKRVVLTSAFGAVGVGHGPEYRRPFDESDWSDLNGPIAPYQKSKTLSERVAWDFIDREGGGLELAAVNPVAVLGPVLGPDYSHSVALVKNMLDGQAGCPNINSGIVDVRDVADLHVRAMGDPAAKGQRFLATAGASMWLADVARVLKDNLGSAASAVSTQVVPDAILLQNPATKGLASLLGMDMNATSVKAMRLLGWNPRSPEEAIVSSAESLIRLGLLHRV